MVNLMSSISNPLENQIAVPHESYAKLFARFLRFGFLAWGGPVAQIAMIRQELVEEEKWISRERFNRVLAIYQALPGPEAHELCVYFGMIARGRIGAILAGLGFMLPGFALMLLLAWFYVTYGIASPFFAAIFFGFKPAVAALIVRAVHRIGAHALTNRWLVAIALWCGIATLLGANFIVTLIFAGLAYLFLQRSQYFFAFASSALFLFGATDLLRPLETLTISTTGAPSQLALFVYGLRTGLLTFGGAYTAIPFLQRDAVVVGKFMTDAQFLDGLALGGILPAPLIIFGTFVGYLGGGALGAILLTIGIFLPAFAFTLIGHEYFERLIENKTAHTFLDGVTAGVVSLIAITAVGLARAAITDWLGVLIFAFGIIVLYRWKSSAVIPILLLASGIIGAFSIK